MQAATFIVPIMSTFPLPQTASIRFQVDQQIDLVFTNLGKVLTSQRQADVDCKFTETSYSVTGAFRGTTFVDVSVDSGPNVRIRIDVV